MTLGEFLAHLELEDAPLDVHVVAQVSREASAEVDRVYYDRDSHCIKIRTELRTVARPVEA